MCAISGALLLPGPAGGPVIPSLLPALRRAVASMNQVMGHRGPDDDTVAEAGPLVLGHRRLSIIDLEGGRQPLSNEDGAVQVICNGEIYNYRELTSVLAGKGHRFRTRSDCEVIVHAYEQWGADILPGLRGMFAFALSDLTSRALLLARDPVGEKPLYYHIGRIGEVPVLSFASEAKALLALPWVERTPDPSGLSDYLRYRYIPAPRTAFREMRKLPAGTCLRIPFDHTGPLPEPRPFWDLAYEPKLHGSTAHLSGLLEERLEEAIRSRLLADVPLGVLLSGGLDSTLVLCMMRRHMPGPLASFCAGFSDPRFDERPLAREVARAFGTVHEECLVGEAAVHDLPRLLMHFDEPFGDPSIMPTYHVARLAAQRVKAVLTGDGGDEAFAGYDRYRRSRLSDLLRALPRGARLLGRALGVISRLNGDLLPGAGIAPLLQRIERSQRAALTPLGDLFEQSVTAFSAEEVRQLLGEGLHTEADAALSCDRVAALFESAEAEHYLDRFLYSDLRAYLADDLMVKSDRMTMAHGLEARAPLLDTELLAFCAALPVEYKRSYGRPGKWVLREIARRILPPEVGALVTGQRKRGFTPPLGHWLSVQAPALSRLLLRPTLVEAGVVRREPFHEFLLGAGGRAEQAWLRSDRRFLLLMLELWHRVVVLGEEALPLEQAA